MIEKRYSVFALRHFGRAGSEIEGLDFIISFEIREKAEEWIEERITKHPKHPGYYFILEQYGPK